MEEKGSVPPKSRKVCVGKKSRKESRNKSAGTSSLSLYSQKKVSSADTVRYEVITKMPKGSLYLPAGCSGTHRGKKRLPFGASAASGGEPWSSDWGVKVLMDLVLSYTRQIVLISSVETFMFPLL